MERTYPRETWCSSYKNIFSDGFSPITKYRVIITFTMSKCGGITWNVLLFVICATYGAVIKMCIVELCSLKQLYLTGTPFKGLSVSSDTQN